MKLYKEVIKNNLKMILFYVFIGILINFLSLYSVTYYQKILDAFQFKTLTIIPIIIYGLLLILSTILSYIENIPEQKVKNQLYFDFKLQALKKMQTINYQEYLNIGTGLLTNLVEEGAASSRNIIFDFYLRLFRELLPTIIFSLYFIYLVEKNFIIFILIGYVFVIMITSIILKKLYSLKENILDNQELLNKHLIRGFMELVVFRTNEKYGYEIEVSKNEIKNIVDTKTKIRLIHEAFFTIFALIVNILEIIILAYAVLNTDLTVGSIVSILTLINKAYQPIAIFNVIYVDYKLDKISSKKYLEFLDIKDDLQMINGEFVNKIKGNIEFKNVSFKYDKRVILNNLSFKIKSGESVAFVGESGAGKSTIIKLMIGLIKYNDGNILIDDKELSNLNLTSFYENVTYISQEVPIFDGTLRENLIFDKNVDDGKIEKVLKLVCLDELYKKMPNKLNTELGEKGIKMSGGEKERIALARLFFDDSKIIVLDEATAALDNITEGIVMNNILTKLKDKTFIIVAHRLETIKNVDNIYLLKDGCIQESGTYNSLMSCNGYFAKLYTGKN